MPLHLRVEQPVGQQLGEQQLGGQQLVGLQRVGQQLGGQQLVGQLRVGQQLGGQQLVGSQRPAPAPLSNSPEFLEAVCQGPAGSAPLGSAHFLGMRPSSGVCKHGGVKHIRSCGQKTLGTV